MAEETISLKIKNININININIKTYNKQFTGSNYYTYVDSKLKCNIFVMLNKTDFSYIFLLILLL